MDHVTLHSLQVVEGVETPEIGKGCRVSQDDQQLSLLKDTTSTLYFRPVRVVFKWRQTFGMSRNLKLNSKSSFQTARKATWSLLVVLTGLWRVLQPKWRETSTERKSAWSNLRFSTLYSRTLPGKNMVLTNLYQWQTQIWKTNKWNVHCSRSGWHWCSATT